MKVKVKRFTKVNVYVGGVFQGLLKFCLFVFAFNKLRMVLFRSFLVTTIVIRSKSVPISDSSKAKGVPMKYTSDHTFTDCTSYVQVIEIDHVRNKFFYQYQYQMLCLLNYPLNLRRSQHLSFFLRYAKCLTALHLHSAKRALLLLDRTGSSLERP